MWIIIPIKNIFFIYWYKIYNSNYIKSAAIENSRKIDLQEGLQNTVHS